MHQVLPTGKYLPGLDYVSMSLDMEVLGGPTLLWHRLTYLLTYLLHGAESFLRS